MVSDEYHEVVEPLEASLSAVAKKSFEPWSPNFVDGGDLLEHFQGRWRGKGGRASLENRTPLQLERDRILYSNGLRRQAEKYHVLYSGRKRIVRSYATHTMRCAQVTRAITRGLNLNQDFAEAVALGSKVGATPFIHAAKVATDKWLREMIENIDNECAGGNDQRDRDGFFDGDEKLPEPVWIRNLTSASTYSAVASLMPWAKGNDVDDAYSSGQQSYWTLCCNPLTVEAIPRQFQPETMFGIWRHSRKLSEHGTTFQHKIKMWEASDQLELLGSAHATLEARVVQLADDITWAIENLEDANTATVLNNENAASLYATLAPELDLREPAESLTKALNEDDAGALYTYFIQDFVTHSRPIVERLETEAPGHVARELVGADDPAAAIGLSGGAEQVLDGIIGFLDDEVFTEPRVRNRRHMLAEVSTQCLNLLYEGDPAALVKITTERARVERWKKQVRQRANELLKRDVYRAQAAVTVFAGMADQEIYDFVGIQAL
jgi:dGTP triphosphohydrolase